MGLGQRLAHAIASSSELAWISQKPAISSCAGANGPLATVRRSPENRTRAPFALGCNPSPASSAPALRELLVVGAHRAEQLLARHHAGFGIVGGFDDHHEPHRPVSSLIRVPSQFGSSLATRSTPPGRTSGSGIDKPDDFFGRTPLRRDRDPARLTCRPGLAFHQGARSSQARSPWIITNVGRRERPRSGARGTGSRRNRRRAWPLPRCRTARREAPAAIRNGTGEVEWRSARYAGTTTTRRSKST